MSFSADVKEELSKLNNLADKRAVKAELFGYINTLNLTQKNKRLKFSTENKYNINRFSKLLNNMNINKYDIEINGKNFRIILTKNEEQKIKQDFEDYEINKIENEEKAFARGVFLGSGTLNNPKNKYHLEITINNEKNADFIIETLQGYGINLKKMKLKTKYCIYSKDGEEISKFLAYIGASNAVIKFEEIRVYRELKNNVNRIVNCETANLNKIANASVNQIEAIKKLKNNGEFNNLPENIKEIAELRLKNPEASLIELGQMLKEPIGKSGVNYRLNVIIKKASN